MYLLHKYIYIFDFYIYKLSSTKFSAGGTMIINNFFTAHSFGIVTVISAILFLIGIILWNKFIK